jgi:hypothetical protein
MDIQALRKLRNNDFSKITQEFEKITNPGTSTKSFDDDRFWKLERDKAGNGSAVIRFLPQLEGDDLPWVRIFNHGFQGPTGRWYIENSLSTIGEKDPLGDLNAKLWNSGSEADKEIARKQKRRLNYTCNILVISDPKHPENEGQVKLFKFGKKIFDMIMDKAKPTFEDETPVNVFDLWEGANFRLRIRQVEGWPSYDKSEFDSPSELFNGDEEKLVALVNKQFPLREFLDKKNFKTFEELSRKLADVLNLDAAPITTASAVAERATVAETPQPRSAPAPQPKAVAASDDDEDILNYFKSIADSD